jgi:hypothetical protein
MRPTRSALPRPCRSESVAGGRTRGNGTTEWLEEKSALFHDRLARCHPLAAGDAAWLGANGWDVVRLVLGRVALLVAIGIAAGATISLWASRFVVTLLYGLEPRDPSTFFAAAVVLAVVGVLAGGLLAWHATRIDPTTVLREG